jgi:TolB protein
MKSTFITTLLILIFTAFFACKKNTPIVEPEKPDPPTEVIDTTKGCPIFDLTPASPYEDPIWHPTGNIIGFNHTPLQEIKYHYGFNCPRQAEYIYKQDSIGFWLINVDGTNKRQILPYKISNPVWSPDGNWLVFYKDAHIYKMPFNGQTFNTAAMVQLTTTGRNFFPTWSPDGEWIAYDSDVETSNGMKYIWKMDKNGLNKTRIAYQPTEGEIRMSSWASDFSIIHIRYLTSVSSGSPEVYRMDASGNQVKRLTNNLAFEYYPKPSPDNSRVAFISLNLSPGDQIQLYSINSEGGDQRKLTQNGSTNFSWGPNNKLVYISYDLYRLSESRGVLFTMDADGGNKKQLTFNKFKLTK